MKTFLSTVAGLIVVIILAAVIIGFIFWSRVPDMLANNLSKKMKVAVQIDSMGLGWGKVTVKGIQVGNPPNSILAKAFSCNELIVNAPFTNYLSKNIVINEIDLNDVYLGLEFDSASGTSGNWTTIMNNINSSTGAGGGAPVSKKGKKQQVQPAPSESARTVLIHRLVLNNIDVDLVYRKDGGKVKKLPRINQIVLTEISSEGGLPMDQIMSSVLGEMLKSIFIKENLKNMLQELMDQKSPIQQYLSPFKGLFNAVSKDENEPAA